MKRHRNRCKEIEKRYWHGNYGTVLLFPGYRKANGRSKKFKPSSETQKRLNDFNAQEKFRMLIDNNFTSSDVELQLGFDIPQLTYEECLHCIQKYLRRVRNYYRNTFDVKVKYVGVIEKGVRPGKFHAHITMNIPEPSRRGEIREHLEDLWEYGTARTFKLEFNEEGMKGLAKYLVCNPDKPEVEGRVKRWIQSKGLKRPKVSERTGRISFEKAKKIISGEVTERDLEPLYPGYTVTYIEQYGYKKKTDSDTYYKQDGAYVRIYLCKKERDRYGQDTAHKRGRVPCSYTKRKRRSGAEKRC